MKLKSRTLFFHTQLSVYVRCLMREFSYRSSHCPIVVVGVYIPRFSVISLKTGMSLRTIGRPAAIASRIGIPNPSYDEGKQIECKAYKYIEPQSH